MERNVLRFRSYSTRYYAVWQKGNNISEEVTASVFIVEDLGYQIARAS
jgi:hypothetical protein